MTKKEIKNIEKRIDTIENKTIKQFEKILHKFCDENKLGFVAGNGLWELIEQSGLEKTDDWRYTFYGDGYTESCLFFRDGNFSNEMYNKRVKELINKFQNIYNLGWKLAQALRRECNILCLCDDYKADFEKRY